jgi:hypothetical protein
MYGEMSQALHQLAPGESVQERVLLNQIYDLSVTGTYEITARREVYLESTKGEARLLIISSDAAFLKVVPSGE